LRIFWARMRLRIRFLRHFQRMWPRFFQTREDRFILGSTERARVGTSVNKSAPPTGEGRGGFFYAPGLAGYVLSDDELSVHVLEFRQRSFQFERRADVDGTEYAIFTRTETESESQFRPRLVRLAVVVPSAWVLYDEEHDALAFARDGQTIPTFRTEAVVEVGAERTEFDEQGIGWKRGAAGAGTFVYAPAELAAKILTPAAAGELGLD
jgi:hypothetical protein